MSDDDREQTTEPSVIGDARFFSILSEIAEFHSDRSEAFGISGAEDNGFDDDPLANVRYASPDFGIDPWVYALIRSNESLRRLQAQIISDEPTNPNLRAEFIKMATHVIISLVLWEEDQAMLADLFVDDSQDD